MYCRTFKNIYHGSVGGHSADYRVSNSSDQSAKRTLRVCKRALHIRKRALYMYCIIKNSRDQSAKRALRVRKRALYILKRALYIHKRALYIRKRALFTYCRTFKNIYHGRVGGHGADHRVTNSSWYFLHAEVCVHRITIHA